MKLNLIVLIIWSVVFYAACAEDKPVRSSRVSSQQTAMDNNPDGSVKSEAEIEYEKEVGGYIDEVKEVDRCMDDLLVEMGVEDLNDGNLEEESLRRCRYRKLKTSVVLDMLAEVKGKILVVEEAILNRCLDAKRALQSLQTENRVKAERILSTPSGRWLMEEISCE